MPCDDPVLRGELVTLRSPVDDDIELLAEIRRHPDVLAHWRGGHDLVAAVHEDLAKEGSHPYVIVLDGRVAGWIQWFEETEPDYRHATIDLYVDAAVHDRGVGGDALRTVCRHLFDVVGHHRITIDPAAHNVRAIACYHKVGFRPVGITRQSERGNDGTWHDGLLLDLLAGELS